MMNIGIVMHVNDAQEIPAKFRIYGKIKNFERLLSHELNTILVSLEFSVQQAGITRQ